MEKKTEILRRADGAYYFNYNNKKYVRKKKADALLLLTELKNTPTVDISESISARIKHTLRVEIINWYNNDYSHTVSVTTAQTNLRTIENQIIPLIGNIQVGSLTKVHMNKFLSSLLDGGYSRSTIKRALNIIKKFYKDTGYIKTFVDNPFESLALPNKRKADNDVKYYTEEELALIYSAAEDKTIWLGEAFILIGLTGLRMGEALALNVKDIDFDNHIIYITKSLACVKVGNHYQSVITPPKTKTSNRVVPMNAECEKAVRTIIEKAKNIRDEYGVDYLLPTKNGKYIFPRSFEKKFKGVLKIAGMDKVMFNGENKMYGVHSLRHSFATLLINKRGANIAIVSKILGHSSVKVTIDVYVHTNTDDLKEVVNLF